MLYSIYGIFGMKDITSSLKIVYFKESIKINKNYYYSLFAELDNNLILFNISSIIKESLSKWLTDI